MDTCKAVMWPLKLYIPQSLMQSGTTCGTENKKPTTQAGSHQCSVQVSWLPLVHLHFRVVILHVRLERILGAAWQQSWKRPLS